MRRDTPGMHAPFFAFEADFVDSLRCIPMAVRLQLDVSGIKLRLNEWSKLDQSQRLALVQQPCITAEEISAYREYVASLILKVCGAAPSMLPELPDPIWEILTEVPGQVLDQARSLGEDIPLTAWAGLSSLQRFALVKLSRAGHENRNFLPALTEFDLLSNS